MNKDKAAKAIATQYGVISEANKKITEIAKSAIPNFHFLDHLVSDSWSDCKKSPIGWCVWDISERGYHIDCSCHYCGEPVERK